MSRPRRALLVLLLLSPAAGGRPTGAFGEPGSALEGPGPRRVASEATGQARECPPPRRVRPEDAHSSGSVPEAVWWAEPGLEPIARLLAADDGAFRRFPGIGEPGPVLGYRPSVYLVRDLDCLEALGLGTPLADWVAGVASSEDGYVALRADPSEEPVGSLRTVLRHEVAHLVLGSATDGNAPRWLQEGYAQYAAGGWNWQEAWRLRFALVTEGRGVLETMSLRFPADREGARLAYMLSYTAVQELAGLAGEEGLRATFEALRSGASFDAAARRVYGLTEGQFEDRWRRSVRQRYGALFVLSRATLFWVLLTLLLFWLRARRRKRDAERRARLEAEERREPEEPVVGPRRGIPRRGEYRP